MQTSNRSDNKNKEIAIACLTGCIFGGSNTIIGHPFDTCKTKMQAQDSFMGSKTDGHGYIDTIKHLYKSEGPIGFYRGCIPPFFGSVIFRSAQFTVYEMAFTFAG